MTDADPIAELLTLTREADLFVAIERIAADADAVRAATSFGQLAQRLYEEKDIAGAVAVRRAGIQFCLCRAPGADGRAELRLKAKEMAYDLGADTWPGWNEAVVLTASELAAGLDAARLNLRLARELDRGPLAESKAHWLLAAHWLAQGQKEAAILEFEQARERARVANDRDQEDLNEGFLALVGALSAQPGAGVELARILERFESSPGQSGKFYARELRTALAVFGKDRAPAAAG